MTQLKNFSKRSKANLWICKKLPVYTSIIGSMFKKTWQQWFFGVILFIPFCIIVMWLLILIGQIILGVKERQKYRGYKRVVKEGLLWDTTYYIEQ